MRRGNCSFALRAEAGDDAAGAETMRWQCGKDGPWTQHRSHAVGLGRGTGAEIGGRQLLMR